MLRTRRRLMQAATSFLPFRLLQGARKEFWDKDPAAWTEGEKQTLLLRSPWARGGVLRLEAEKRRGAQQGPATVAVPGGGVPGARPGGAPGSGSTPTVPIGEPIPPAPGAGKGEPPQFNVRVRWESARPVRLAGGPELPAEAAGFYVIRLQGMPLMRPRPNQDGTSAADANQGLLEAIKQSSRIERRNQPAIPCAHLLTGSGEAATELLLFFPRGSAPIALPEKEVTVVSRLGSFHLAVKFRLSEMVFQSKLEL